MSKITHKQWLESSIVGSPLYAVELYKTPISDKEFEAIRRRVFAICNDEDCSCLLISSSTASNKNLRRVCIRTDRPGKPKKVIIGDTVPKHIHMGIVGKHAHKAATKSKTYFDKKFGKNDKKVSRIQCLSDIDCHSRNFIDYCYRQADCVRTCGDFDFEKYTSCR